MKLEELDWKNVALGIAAPSSLLSLRIRLWRVEETNLLSELDRELSILFPFLRTQSNFSFLFQPSID